MDRFEIFTEITPLSESGCFLVIDRVKDTFSHPPHVHSEYELNFIVGGTGAKRLVGDSTEEINDLDLTLIANPNLYHHWVKHQCKSNEIREITIQFHPEFLDKNLLERAQFHSIREMLEASQRGLSFSHDTIAQIRPELESLKSKKGFYAVLSLLHILYELSQATNVKRLASNRFVGDDHFSENERIRKIIDFLNHNYFKEIKLADVASQISMSEVAFCRYFRKNTGKSLIEYLNDIRTGMASKMLAEPSKPISEICYECGFNNLSNFNRCFKKKKGCTPSEFRENFIRTRQII